MSKRQNLPMPKDENSSRILRRRRVARPSASDIVSTLCRHTERSHRVRGYRALCTAHCATIATVEDGKVTRLDADHDHPNGGVLCIKGKAAPELVYHPDRLNYPLKRTRPKSDTDPGWQRVSWDQALDEIAERLNLFANASDRAQSPSKGTRGGTSVSDAERWLARFLNGFGSPNWVSTTHVCNWHKDTGFSYTLAWKFLRPSSSKQRLSPLGPQPELDVFDSGS